MRILSAVMVMCVLSGAGLRASGRGPSPLTARPSQGQLIPTNCEYNDSILNAVHQEAGADGLIIAIARLGDGEHRRELSRRRLHNVRTFLDEFGGRNPATVITAEGERAKGPGRVELYVGGALFHTFAVKRNKDLAVGVCVYDEPEGPCADKRQMKLYPCLESRSRRK